MSLYTFSKSERLCSKKLIKELFDKGSSFYLYPFRVYHLSHPEEDMPHQVLISVPKRNFKKAVDRNKIKRRIKEAYRLSKLEHLGAVPSSQMIAYIYTAKESHDYHLIQEKLIDSLKRLKKDTQEK